MKRTRISYKWYFLAAFFVLCLFLACQSRDKTSGDVKKPSTAHPKPNVIVLLVDTLRPDFIGAYGGKYPTPVMDMLAGQGTTFNNVVATSSWTVPSVASILTGMYPQKHGLTNGVTVHVQVFKQQKIPESYPLLAEQFQKAGYTTFGITMNAHMDEFYGYNRGFDHYVMEKFQDAPVLEQKVESWKGLLEQASKTTGYFLYLHWVDPHHPYSPVEPYISQIRPNYLSQIGRTLDDVGPEHLREIGYFKDYPKHLDVLKDVYASEVLRCDASIGKVLKMLPDVGNSLVAFTSDHGEAFNEHDSMLHGYDLFQETIHVPLVLIYPHNQETGKRVDTRVSLVDLPPTLLAFAGIKAPETFQGKDLKPLISGAPTSDRKIWSHLDKNGQYRWEAVIDNNLKFVQNEHGAGKVEKAKEEGKPLQPTNYLFDLTEDPGEKKNLASKRPADCSRFEKDLKSEMDQPPLTEPETIEQEATQELMDKFRQTGYL